MSSGTNFTKNNFINNFNRIIIIKITFFILKYITFFQNISLFLIHHTLIIRIFYRLVRSRLNKIVNGMHRRVTKSEEKKTWNGNWRAKGTGKRKPRTLPDFYETRAGRAIELISILAIPRNFANSQGHKHGLLFVQGFQA